MHLLRSISIVASVLSAVVSALPTASPGNAADLVDILSKRVFAGKQISNCDLSKAVLPKSDGTTALAGPDPGLTVTRVVLGRGTQNYTCADSKDTTLPVSAGALAILYDASCLAANFPSLLHLLPGALVALSESRIETILQRVPNEPFVAGHHYFAPDFSTPVFDFRLTAGQTQIFTGVRDQAVPASSNAAKGGLGDQQFGAVDWLRLKAIPAMSVDYKLAYRVQTAGGKAPPTCKGRAGTITIEYATEYWFYN